MYTTIKSLSTDGSTPAGRIEVIPRSAAAMPALDLDNVIAWLRSGLVWIVVLTALGLGAALLFSMVVKPRYTVYTDILVDPANLQVVSNDVFTQSSQSDSQLLDVESKLRVLTSGNVLKRVVVALDLANDPEFVDSTPAFGLGSFFGASGPADPADPQLMALRSLEERVSARREERSYVVTLAVWTQDAPKSVLIASAVTQAFQDELASAEADGAGRAATALTDRLAELKANVTTAEEQVEAFRREHGLQASSGELVSAQMVSRISTQLLDAQQKLIEAKSRYDELTTGNADANTSAAALQSPTITGLRAQYATLKQQADQLAVTYGPRHPAMQAVQPQLESLNLQISAEVARIVASAKADLDQARSVVGALEAQSADLRGDAQTDSDAMVRFRELDRDAKAAAALYEAFLARAGQVTERQDLDTSNVRVISYATLPKSRSYPPRTVVLLGMGGIGGLALGIGLALGLGFLGDLRRLHSGRAA